MKPILSTRDAFHSILSVSLPLVAGLGTTTVMEFTDRIFLGGYLFFNGLTYVFCGVLKGAGDTRFVMLSHAAAALVCMLLPLWIVRELDLGLYAAWSCACAYVVSLSIVSWYRFRQGAWREMRVVEVRD